MKKNVNIRTRKGKRNGKKVTKGEEKRRRRRIEKGESRNAAEKKEWTRRVKLWSLKYKKKRFYKQKLCEKILAESKRNNSMKNEK